MRRGFLPDQTKIPECLGVPPWGTDGSSFTPSYYLENSINTSIVQVDLIEKLVVKCGV